MKIRMKKEYCQRRSQRHYHKQHEQYDRNKYFGKNSLKRIHWLMLMEMILQKEKDLELAAQIGQSLLEQNHELQTRSFILLFRELQTRSFIPLFHELQIRSFILPFHELQTGSFILYYLISFFTSFSA